MLQDEDLEEEFSARCAASTSRSTADLRAERERKI